VKRSPLRRGRAELERRTELRRDTPAARQFGAKRAKPARIWGGHPTQYGRARRWVESRAGGRCEARVDGVCESRGVHAHHIKPRSAGRDDSMGNLLWVCRACHEFIHAHPALSYERGWLRRRGA
jgi:hypothetical protein